MKSILKFMSGFLLLIILTGCENKDYMGNLKNTDSTFWIKVVVTMVFLAGVLWLQKKLRR